MALTQVLDATRDPAIYRLLQDPGVKYALGLDLGTNCGVALRMLTTRPGQTPILGNLYLGQWILDSGQYDSSPIRFVRLRAFLTEIRPSLVFYENPRHAGLGPEFAGASAHVILARAATSLQLLGSLRDTMTTWCEENKIPTQAFDLATIKKHAAGKGNAGKPAMIEACNKKFGTTFSTTDYESEGLDNIADAAHALDLGLSLYGTGL